MRSVRLDPADLTARARIRDAAIRRFAVDGFGASVRAIAAEAGVSPALVIHHFGSKENLRAVCDDHVLKVIRDAETDAFTSRSPGDLFAYLGVLDDYAPLVGYLVQALLAGGDLAATLLERMTKDAEVYLADAVAAGRFRADLFYRLNVISLHVPPLRHRREDIPALVEHFLALFRERFNRPALDLSPEARQRLNSYDWPGNVRELRNALERAAALAAADSDTIEADQLIASAPSPTTGGASTPTDATPLTLDQLERQHILRVLEEQGGNRERAAAVLGISARTLYRKLREYGD